MVNFPGRIRLLPSILSQVTNLLSCFEGARAWV